MSLRSDEARWGSVTRWLHWAIALAVVALATVGWIMKSMALSPLKVQVYAAHKSLGLTVLALVLVRIGWRLFERARPARSPGTPPWQHRLAGSVHLLMYAVLLVMPLSGWLFNSAANFPLRWFGLFRVPALAGPDPALKALAGDIHLYTFWVLLGLFLLHVAGALKHHWLDRDDVLRAMLGTGPRVPPSPPGSSP